MSTATLTKTKTKIENVNVANTLADISAAVERVKNDALQHFPAAASPGDAVRQGDLYIQLLDESDFSADLLRWVTPVPAADLPNRLQLAEGNTKGSRHVLANTEGLEMWLPLSDDESILKAIYAHNKTPFPKTGANPWSSPFRTQFNSAMAALALAGPVFRCSTPNVVTHPEHGDWALPAGLYRVIFQRTVDESQRIRRVLD